MSMPLEILNKPPDHVFQIGFDQKYCPLPTLKTRIGIIQLGTDLHVQFNKAYLFKYK